MERTPASSASARSLVTLVEETSSLTDTPLSYSEKRIQKRIEKLQAEFTDLLDLSFGKPTPSISSNLAFTPTKIISDHVRPPDNAARPLKTIAKVRPLLPIPASDTSLPDLKRAGKLWPQWLSKLNLKKAVQALKQRAVKKEADDWASSIEHAIKPEQQLDANCLAPGQIDNVLLDLFPAAKKHETHQFLQSINTHLQKTQSPSNFLEPGLIPVAYQLAQVCEGDLQQAKQVFERLTQKLEINPTGAQVASKIDELAWRCAQEMAHLKGTVLTALLRLQNLPREQTGMFNTGPAEVLTVYLQASYLLNELLGPRDSALINLNDLNTRSQLEQEPKADLALQALKSARLLDLSLSSESSKKSLDRSQAAAFRLWQWGFRENQEGSELCRVRDRSYKAGTDWVERGDRHKKIRDEIAQTSIWSKRYWRARGKQITKNLRNVANQDKTPYAPNDNPLFGIDQKQIQEYNNALIDACQLLYNEGMNRLDTRQISPTPQRDSERNLFLNTVLQVAQLEAWTEQSISSQTKQGFAHPQNYDLATRASRKIRKKATRLIESQASRLPATEIKAMLEMLDVKMVPLSRFRFFRSRSKHLKSAPFDLNALKKIGEEFFSNKNEKNFSDKYGLKNIQRNFNDRIQKIEKLAPFITPALDEITSETLHKQAQAFMEQHQTGNSRQTTSGGRRGINVALPIGLGVSIIPSLKASHSNQATYKIGSTESTRFFAFGASKQNAGYTGVNVVAGLPLIEEQPKLNIIGGIGAGGGPFGRWTKGYDAEISTRRPVPSRSKLSSEDSEREWRKNGEEMAKLYWESIKKATDAKDNLEYYASECFYKNPNIALSWQKIGQTELGFFSGVFMGSQLDVKQPIRLGGALTLFNETVLYDKRTVQSKQQQSEEKSRGWRNKTMLMQSTSLAPTGIPISKESDLTLSLRSKALLPSRILSSSRRGHLNVVHIEQDEQGIIPELTYRDVIHLKARDFEHHARQRWTNLPGQEALEGFLNTKIETPKAYPVSAERLLINPAIAAQLDECANLATVLKQKQKKHELKLVTQKDASHEKKSHLKAQIQQLTQRIQKLDDLAKTLIKAETSWVPSHLYSQLQGEDNHTPGLKYLVVVTPERSASGVSDIQRLPIPTFKNVTTSNPINQP
ncbi:MAG: hypothetical protein ON057_001612 [Glomeribacter sp. 1016415]|nr:hypothetical protein [Glomeribacter sp. 1016415]